MYDKVTALRAEGTGACVLLCFKNFSPLTSNVVNRYNPHKQNSLRFSVIFKSIREYRGQRV